MAGKLILGPKTGDLTVLVVVNEPWTATAILKKRNIDGTWTRIAWPFLPMLWIEGLDDQITPTLTADEDTSTTDSQATWHMDLSLVQLLETGLDAKLQLNGESAWVGRVTCRS